MMWDLFSNVITRNTCVNNIHPRIVYIMSCYIYKYVYIGRLTRATISICIKTTPLYSLNVGWYINHKATHVGSANMLD